MLWPSYWIMSTGGTTSRIVRASRELSAQSIAAQDRLSSDVRPVATPTSCGVIATPSVGSTRSECKSASVRRGPKICQLVGFSRVYPTERPRFNRAGGAYTPKSQQQQLLFELDSFPKLKVAKPIFVDIVFFLDYRSVPPTSKKAGDLDNLTKAFFDAMVEVGILDDDRWIVGSETKKVADTEPWYRADIYEATIHDQTNYTDARQSGPSR